MSVALSMSLLVALAIAAAVVSAAWLIQRRSLRRSRAAAAESGARADRLALRLAELERPGEGSGQSEERYRTPLDQLHDYTIFLLDPQGRPTSWNRSVERVLGYQREPFLAGASEVLYTEEDRAAGRPAGDLTEAARLGRMSADRWVVRADGSRFWASVSMAGVHGPDGRLLGFAMRLRDLSESRRTQEQLQRQQQALELALEAAGLGTWEQDLASGALHCDERGSALLGLAFGTDLTSRSWADVLHPEDRDRTLARWAAAGNGSGPFSSEFRVIWPDGGVHTIMAMGRVIPDPETAAPLRMAGVMLDLTERRRTEAHLQESLRLEAVGRLAGGVAHDLNNMLAAILGFTEFLARSLDPDDPRRTDVEQISQAAERSAALTRQLLAFARRELIQPKPLDVNVVVRNALAMLPPILGENIELELRLAPVLGAVYADERQVEQTLMNLVLNARDAMPRGGRVTIETRTTQVEPGSQAWQAEPDYAPAGRFVMLAVSDTGHGMEPDTLRRIWEPFFTTKPVGRGTGLGLSSVYGAAKQSGGFVRADSEPGRGTTVQVYWPEMPEGAKPLAAKDAPPEVAGGRETVLVVEDEQLVRELALRTLRSLGYECLVARDAAEALRVVEQDRALVDLVITDVVMPGMSGGGLGERLAIIRPRLPVLYTSAFTDEEVIRRGLLESGRPFLQKPWVPRDLARMVRQVLDAVPLEADAPETV